MAVPHASHHECGITTAHKFRFAGRVSCHGVEYISALFFGISQSVSSPASYVSSVTVDGALNLAVAYCEPIWAADEAAKFTDDLVAICERVGLADAA